MLNNSHISNALLLTGRSGQHVKPCWNCQRVHVSVLTPLLKLKEKAAKAGFQLEVASGFRSFDRQMTIWQRKLSGESPILSPDSQPLALEDLSPAECLQALLRWSAVPGTSRHHWGTDMDVYDAAAIEPDYQLQLVPEEYTGNGPFAPFACWLQEQIEQGNSEGFFMPYATDCGGVAPEPWHISYKPLADQFQQQFNLPLLQQLLGEPDLWPFHNGFEMQVKAQIDAQQQAILAHYIQRQPKLSMNGP